MIIHDLHLKNSKKIQKKKRKEEEEGIFTWAETVIWKHLLEVLRPLSPERISTMEIPNWKIKPFSQWKKQIWKVNWQIKKKYFYFF